MATTSREWHLIDASGREIIRRHQEQLPVRLSQIAADLGLIVRSSTLPAGISGEIRPSEETRAGYIIRVNRHDAEVRQRFTVAHEIAHYLLHRDQIGVGIRDDALYRSNLSNSREAEANRLAADILMPDQLVSRTIDAAHAVGSDDVVGFASRRFNVSEAAMKIRLGIS